MCVGELLGVCRGVVGGVDRGVVGVWIAELLGWG